MSRSEIQLGGVYRVCHCQEGVCFDESVFRNACVGQMTLAPSSMLLKQTIQKGQRTHKCKIGGFVWMSDA